MKNKKSTKQLIIDLKQQIHDLKVESETKHCILLDSIKELTRDLEVRKFKEKAKGEKYIIGLGKNIYCGLRIDISYLSENKEKVIQFNTYINNSNFRDEDVDYKVNEDYIEIYVDNEIVYVGKVKGFKLEDVDLELYKKAYTRDHILSVDEQKKEEILKIVKNNKVFCDCGGNRL